MAEHPVRMYAMERCKNFPDDVSRRLRKYVYRLIDPRNGETFYVGKGEGNRVFAHIRAEANLKGDELDNKMARIRAISLAGLEVGHVIHRHGMNDKTALEVEATLMDAYPGLTNIAGGAENERGAMHAQEVLAQYGADFAEFRHKAVLFNVSRNALKFDLYEATRYAWRINKARVTQAEVVLATVHGVIRGAFVWEKWLAATPEHFPGRPPVPKGKFGFVGREAPRDITRLYVGKRVPPEYRGRHPFRYTWKPNS